MSFKCYFCKKTAEPGVKAHMISTIVREKQETHPGGDRGLEIVREERMCGGCYQAGVSIDPTVKIDTSSWKLPNLSMSTNDV